MAPRAHKSFSATRLLAVAPLLRAAAGGCKQDPDGRTTVQFLAEMAPSEVLIFEGQDYYDLVGYRVAAVGDVNNDGFDDVLISTNDSSVGSEPNEGVVYLVFGSASFASANPLHLPALAASKAVKIIGWGVNSEAKHIAAAGDINGDSCADFIVKTRLIYGGATFAAATADGVFDIATEFDATTGAEIYDMQPICGLGDFNGDSIPDLLAFRHSEINIILGGAGLNAAIADGNFNYPGDFATASGITIQNISPAANSGIVFTRGGDINGDGLADAVVAVPRHSPLGRTEAGSIFVIFGRSVTGHEIWNFNVQVPSAVLEITGRMAGEKFGWCLSGGFDTNGDGAADLVLAPSDVADPHAIDRPMDAAIVFGSPSLASMAQLDLATLTNPIGFFITGETTEKGGEGNQIAGHIGDIDDDGFADFACTANTDNFSSDGPRIYQITGNPYLPAFGEFSLTAVDTRQWRKRLDGIPNTARYGIPRAFVAPAGDFNGDGIADWLIYSQGAYIDQYGACGRVCLIFGKRRQ